MPAQIRWTDADADREARVEVVRRAWHGAYSHLFTASEIDAVFDGRIPLRGDWTSRRTAPAGTLVAAVDGEVVGLVSLGHLEPGIGEVAALYVVPEWQGSGIGGQLWSAGLAVLAHRGLARMEVWTLADAPARGFYEHEGCEPLDRATLSVGDHSVDAVGYGLALDGTARDAAATPDA